MVKIYVIPFNLFVQGNCYYFSPILLLGDRKRYKKLITTEGKTHMVLIRVEGDPPSEEVSLFRILDQYTL